MIESFKIENYRRFKSFNLSKLGRVNLLVGENNSGKTSVLEAVYLYSSYPNLASLLEILNYRGEFAWKEDDSLFNSSIDSPIKRMRKDFNISNLFYGYKFTQNIDFSFISHEDNKKYKLNISIKNKFSDDKDFGDNTTEQLSIFDSEDLSNSYSLNKHILSFYFSQELNSHNESPIEIEVSDKGYLLIDSIKKNLTLRRKPLTINTNKTVRLITLFEQDIEDLIEIFDSISLTPNEEIVIDAVKIIEPRIKRIATTKSERGEKGSFKVLLEGYQQPIPVGTMGDGIWRLLTIALAMVNTKNGVLLIDEIDTGLHFTTLLKMWELILETSKKLNIQVFATTHNSDCWMALGELIAEKNEEENNNYIAENEIILHRIEADKNESILFDAEGIVIAKDNDIEVR